MPFEPYWSAADAALYLGDSLDVMRSWPENHVDAIVTSPEYADQRKYAHGADTAPEAFADAFEPFLVEMLRVVLALMLTTADDEGPAAAFLNVVGWAKPGQARRIAAEEFLASIKHVWLRERPDINDEAMEFCLPGDDGAQAFTQVDVHV